MCVCVSVRERERDRIKGATVDLLLSCVCVCVCECVYSAIELHMNGGTLVMFLGYKKRCGSKQIMAALNPQLEIFSPFME